MSLLLVDLGNSALKWAGAESGRLLAPTRMGWRDSGLEAVLQQRWAALAPPERVAACSVAPEAQRRLLEQWVARHWGCPVDWVQAQSRAAGVVCGYRDPVRLGADRWAALVAAHRRYPQGCLVVDLGTAVTLDALAGGRHLGGYILPGVSAMARALATDTGLAVEPAAPPEQLGGLWGDSTDAAIRLGLAYSLLALVESALERLQAAGVCDPTLVLTGGGAGFLRPHMQIDYRHHPHLVLEGVLRLAEEPRS